MNPTTYDFPEFQQQLVHARSEMAGLTWDEIRGEPLLSAWSTVSAFVKHIEDAVPRIISDSPSSRNFAGGNYATTLESEQSRLTWGLEGEFTLALLDVGQLDFEPTETQASYRDRRKHPKMKRAASGPGHWAADAWVRAYVAWLAEGHDLDTEPVGNRSRPSALAEVS